MADTQPFSWSMQPVLCRRQDGVTEWAQIAAQDATSASTGSMLAAIASDVGG